MCPTDLKLRVQVELVAEQLAHLGFQRIVVSPFQRCIETAKLLNSKLNLPLSSWQIDSGVCEVRCRFRHVPTARDFEWHEEPWRSRARLVKPCTATELGPANHDKQSTLLQVLNPKTLVGSQLTPPVGLAKDWMWGRGSLRAALTEALGEEGRHCSAAPHID